MPIIPVNLKAETRKITLTQKLEANLSKIVRLFYQGSREATGT